MNKDGIIYQQSHDVFGSWGCFSSSKDPIPKSVGHSEIFIRVSKVMLQVIHSQIINHSYVGLRPKMAIIVYTVIQNQSRNQPHKQYANNKFRNKETKNYSNHYQNESVLSYRNGYFIIKIRKSMMHQMRSKLHHIVHILMKRFMKKILNQSVRTTTNQQQRYHPKYFMHFKTMHHPTSNQQYIGYESGNRYPKMLFIYEIIQFISFEYNFLRMLEQFGNFSQQFQLSAVQFRYLGQQRLLKINTTQDILMLYIHRRTSNGLIELFSFILQTTMLQFTYNFVTNNQISIERMLF